MPRTVEEILASSDKLVARFEEYTPSPEDELDVTAVNALRAAVAERSNAERHLKDAVQAARRTGMSWDSIGTFVGSSAQRIQQDYGDLVA